MLYSLFSLMVYFIACIILLFYKDIFALLCLNARFLFIKGLCFVNINDHSFGQADKRFS